MYIFWVFYGLKIIYLFDKEVEPLPPFENVSATKIFLRLPLWVEQDYLLISLLPIIS